jgi:hypothetical protein
LHFELGQHDVAVGLQTAEQHMHMSVCQCYVNKHRQGVQQG